MSARLAKVEGFDRAKAHEATARRLRAQAWVLQMNAVRHERWARKWYDWTDDEYGDVPYPVVERQTP